MVGYFNYGSEEDPFSPLLFCLVGEVLSKEISQLASL